jgi:hypothetical protein
MEKRWFMEGSLEKHWKPEPGNNSKNNRKCQKDHENIKREISLLPENKKTMFTNKLLHGIMNPKNGVGIHGDI